MNRSAGSGRQPTTVIGDGNGQSARQIDRRLAHAAPGSHRQGQAAGADAADAVLYNSVSLSLSQRLGKPERLERAEEGDLGLRVFVGRRMAIASSSDRSSAALDEVVDRAVAMARIVPEDPYCGVADPDQLAREWPQLDLRDPVEPAADRLIALAGAAEESALAVAA